MKPEYKKWADLILQGKEPVEAYLIVYPTASKKTAQNQVSRFRKDVGLNEYLAHKGKLIDTALTAKVSEELIGAELSTLLTAAKKRELLAQIANGTLEGEKIVIVNGKPKKIRCKPDFHDIMKAIELDNRMTGDNTQAKPNQVKKAEEITKIVIVEDKRSDA